MNPTIITTSRAWPEFKAGEVLRIKNPGGAPGLWRTYAIQAPLNSSNNRGPFRYTAEVNTAPAPFLTNKTTPTHTPIIRMGRG